MVPAPRRQNSAGQTGPSKPTQNLLITRAVDLHLIPFDRPGAGAGAGAGASAGVELIGSGFDHIEIIGNNLVRFRSLRRSCVNW